MEGIITGISVGVAMIVINAVVSAYSARNKSMKKTDDNERRIRELEAQTDEIKELLKLTLATCIIIGDGMVENGINGEFKKAFCEKKQDALKML